MNGIKVQCADCSKEYYRHGKFAGKVNRCRSCRDAYRAQQVAELEQVRAEIRARLYGTTESEGTG